ncbi:hypothetical protein TNCV_65431 [Trichonephila clavipes]|nr:hypothetical protein TNCV_65431 [Trichonephila clavipes]
MANIEAFKKSRKTERAAFTKACSRVEYLIAVENVDIGELEISKKQQIRAHETLGVTTENCACLLYPLVESCMSEDFLRAFQRGLNLILAMIPKRD